jgi:RNA polymerase sigma-70 factor (ECF subfamily)
MASAGGEPAALEDARLVRDLGRGDVAAFETVYRRRSRAVYGLAYHLCGRHGDAEELAQEVFVRLWQHRSDVQSREHLDRWLRRVTVNTWINQLRRTREASFEALVEDGLPEPEAPAAHSGAVGLDLERALAALPPALRAVVVLFDVYGLRHDEIAELVGITAGSSKVQLHRARRRLKEWLQ